MQRAPPPSPQRAYTYDMRSQGPGMHAFVPSSEKLSKDLFNSAEAGPSSARGGRFGVHANRSSPDVSHSPRRTSQYEDAVDQLQSMRLSEDYSARGSQQRAPSSMSMNGATISTGAAQLPQRPASQQQYYVQRSEVNSMYSDTGSHHRMSSGGQPSPQRQATVSMDGDGASNSPGKRRGDHCKQDSLNRLEADPYGGIIESEGYSVEPLQASLSLNDHSDGYAAPQYSPTFIQNPDGDAFAPQTYADQNAYFPTPQYQQGMPPQTGYEQGQPPYMQPFPPGQPQYDYSQDPYYQNQGLSHGHPSMPIYGQPMPPADICSNLSALRQP